MVRIPGNGLKGVVVALLCAAGMTPVFASTVVANNPKGTSTGSVAAAIEVANKAGGGTVIQLVGPAATLDSLSEVVRGVRTAATVQAPSLAGVLADVSGSSPAVTAMERAVNSHRLSLLLDRQSATVYVLNDVPQRFDTATASEPLAPTAPLAAAVPPAPMPAAVANPGATNAMSSRTSAVVTASVAPAAPMPSAEPYSLPAGMLLSEALDTYVKRYGWTLKWTIRDDYRLDAPVPIPAMDVIDGVTYVVKTYQSQGGMKGVSPRFAKPNRVVIVELMGVRDQDQ